ncbi:nucleotidyl transferase AbiEii/AbiGii toxin family protein [Phenylobacterium ferrooxidans]|uniref:Nucleotidyl transferase AbiEii/AbiGii toxin family protein n=1 Tax=Phenylobacterium ferrooxidans TaxID=2982689 RepID=A0ABW6CXI2_9CAUL
MSAPSAQTLQRLANETGLQAGTLEKVLRLLEVLQEIARDPILANRLVLKGGTALNVFHLALDRLSVDIDLNYVGALDRADMEADRPEVDAALNRLLTAQGYAIRRQPDDHAGGKWIGRFASAMGGGGSLEVDINYMSRQPLFGAVKMDSVDLGGVRASGVAVLDLHEVVAGKLVALIDRNAARDLFDARRILDIDGLDWAKIKAAVLAYGAAGRRDWRLASVDAIGGDPRELRQKLAICLPQNRFVAAGGPEAWIAQTVAECRARLAPLFELNAAEAAFLDGILDRGEIDPGGLDVAREVQVRIAAMPMLAWKCQNVRAHRGKPG